jgi:lipoprotein-anchoring transpeptidase ErfK/SrfK
VKRRRLAVAALGGAVIAAGYLAASAWSSPLMASAAASGTCPAWVTTPPAPPKPSIPRTTTTPKHVGSTPARTTTPTTTTMATTTTAGLTATVLARAPAPLLSFNERTVAVGPTTALLTGSTSGAHAEPTVAEYWRAGGSPQCAAVDPGAGSISVKLTHLQPSSRYHFRIAAEGAAGTAFGAAPTFATLPAGTIPEGVMIGHTRVGKLRRAGALDLVDRGLTSPLRFAYAGAYWRLAPAAAGLHTNAAALVGEALQAMPGQTLAGPTVSVEAPVLNGYLAGLDKRYGHKPTEADVRLLGTRAVIVAGRNGVELESKLLATVVRHQLETGTRTTLSLPVKRSPATAAGVDKAVVVRLGSQTLTAYRDGKPILRTPVTTGRPALPTPVGSYAIQFRASPYVFTSPWPPGNVYYYPPTPVTWAMDFYDGDFLHDDPGEPSDAFGAGSEYGPYASHGCVHVPHDAMAFLYNWLPVGARVIVAQS